MKAIKFVLAVILFPFGIFFWVPLILRVGMAHIGVVLFFSIIGDQIDGTKQKSNLQAAFGFLGLLYQNIFATTSSTTGSTSNAARPSSWIKTWLNIIWAVLFWATILVPILFPASLMDIKSKLFPIVANGSVQEVKSAEPPPLIETVETWYADGTRMERYTTRNGQKHGRYEMYHAIGNEWTAREYEFGRLKEVYYVKSRDGRDYAIRDFSNGNGKLIIYDEYGPCYQGRNL